MYAYFFNYVYFFKLILWKVVKEREISNVGENAYLAFSRAIFGRGDENLQNQTK